MSLIETLQKEMVKALKEGNKFRKITLSTLIASIKKFAIDNGARDNITDELAVSVLKKEKKSLQDAVDKFPDMPVEKKEEYLNQCKIIKEFIPQEISDPFTIGQIIAEIAQENYLEISKANTGKFMKILKTNYSNLNMKVASKVYGEKCN